MSKYDTLLNMQNDNSMSIILNNIKPNSRVLEMGPATGYMTKFLKESLNCKVVCVELDQNAASNAAEHCEQLIIADLNKLEWYEKLINEDSFDYILWADVLEHLLNPSEPLSYSRKLLKNDGKIFISTPNILHNAILMEMLEGRFNYQKLGLLDETHTKFFTKDSLLSVLDESQLVVTKWMNTMVAPEDTEFHQNYNKFPAEIRDYLISRDTGDVYQFIVECEISNDKLNNNGSSVSFPCTLFSKNTSVQLYWNNKKSVFDPINTITIDNNADNTQHFSINTSFSSEGFSKLRIDPGDFPCVVFIEKFILELENNQIFDIQSFLTGKIKFENSNYFKLDNTFLFIFKHEDPQIIMDFNEIIGEAKLVKVNLEIEIFDRPNDYLNVLGDVIQKQIENENRYKVRVKELENNIESLSTNIGELREKLTKLNTVIKDREGKIHSIGKELNIKQDEIRNIKNSLSWRATRPLRLFKTKFFGGKTT